MPLQPGVAAAAGAAWRVARLTNDDAIEHAPMLSGRYAAWHGPGSGALAQIFVAQLPARVVNPITDGQVSPSFGERTFHLAEGHIVWAEGFGSPAGERLELWHRDLGSGIETEIPLPAGTAVWPTSVRIEPPHVVWDGTDLKLYLHDLETGVTRSIHEPCCRLGPEIDAGRVAWDIAPDGGEPRVLVHEIASETTREIARGEFVALDGNGLLVRRDAAYWVHDLETAEGTRIVEADAVSAFPFRPALDGTRLAWLSADRVLHLHDLESAVTKVISDPDRDAFDFALAARNLLFVQEEAEGCSLRHHDVGTGALVTVVPAASPCPKELHAWGDMAVWLGGRPLSPPLITDVRWGFRDDDLDTIPNDFDTCRDVHNLAQRDTDEDGFGNACDPDLNGDGVADFLDLALLLAVFGTDDPDADLDGDGAVGESDATLLKRRFFAPPGPAGPAA